MPEGIGIDQRRAAVHVEEAAPDHSFHVRIVGLDEAGEVDDPGVDLERFPLLDDDEVLGGCAHDLPGSDGIKTHSQGVDGCVRGDIAARVIVDVAVVFHPCHGSDVAVDEPVGTGGWIQSGVILRRGQRTQKSTVKGHQAGATTAVHIAALHGLQRPGVAADGGRLQGGDHAAKQAEHDLLGGGAGGIGTDSDDPGGVIDGNAVVATSGAPGVGRVGVVNFQHAPVVAREGLERTVKAATGTGVEVEYAGAVIRDHMAEVFMIGDGGVRFQQQVAVAEIGEACVVEAVVVVRAGIDCIGGVVQQGQRSPAREGDGAGLIEAAIGAGQRHVEIHRSRLSPIAAVKGVADPAAGRLLDEDVPVEIRAVARDAQLTGATDGETRASVGAGRVVKHAVKLRHTRMIKEAGGAVVAAGAATEVKEIAIAPLIGGDAAADEIDRDVREDVVKRAAHLAVPFTLKHTVVEVEGHAVKSQRFLGLLRQGARVGDTGAPVGTDGKTRINHRVSLKGRLEKIDAKEIRGGAAAIGQVNVVVRIPVVGEVHRQAVQIDAGGCAGAAEQPARFEAHLAFIHRQ